ncbi:hypothetical protein QBC41DRAFT_388182 [Cercophora samala]|uniref:TauD/TfdA-like domain-containing protein n=1 Tax=Cercophora samala TaxID=330535 RepID=A0AA39ZMV8_9PEZI|nr:hypothetical protein QBC41DRAFT_388182 [Cercophora samala]
MTNMYIRCFSGFRGTGCRQLRMASGSMPTCLRRSSFSTFSPSNSSVVESRTGPAQIPVDFIFSDKERDHLKSSLLKVTDSPYSAYPRFEEQIDHLLATGAVADRFQKLCETKRGIDSYHDPYFLIKNCPIDDNLPHLSFQTPVADKRTLKKTFVSEGFLLLYAKLMRQEPIGYLNFNDGDIFHDVHPMQRMAKTQSQKGLDTVRFHKDLPNHFVRPDWVNLLGLRADPANRILTCFVNNKDLLASLPAETKTVLRQEAFHTPYDEMTVSSGNKKLGDAPSHRVLGGGATEYEIRFFEGRTVGLTDRARRAVDDVVAALHRLKRPLLILRGDFIGLANNECLHNKEVVRIGNADAQRSRWLMKTVNVRSLGDHGRHMVEGQVRTVNG